VSTNNLVLSQTVRPHARMIHGAASRRSSEVRHSIGHRPLWIRTYHAYHAFHAQIPQARIGRFLAEIII
jgi:hypothetical protein